MEKNLGHATAYGYAKSKGYSGTEDEFAELMADYASVGQSAAQSAEQAAASATSASGSAATASEAAQTATSKASEAVTAAGTATTKASEASTSADTASTAAQTATDKASIATTAATTATTKASEAAASEAAALSAKTDAESARDAAAQSASAAAESARTLTIDTTLTQSGQAADAKATGDAITELKNDLNANTETIQGDLYETTTNLLDFTFTQSLWKQGAPNARTQNYTIFYDKQYAVTQGQVIYGAVRLASISGFRLIAFAYDSDNNFISRTQIAYNAQTGSYTVPENVAYVYFGFTTNSATVPITPEQIVALGNAAYAGSESVTATSFLKRYISFVESINKKIEYYDLTGINMTVGCPYRVDDNDSVVYYDQTVINYRIGTPEIHQYDYDITFTPKTGYKIYFWEKAEGANSYVVSGWKTTAYTVSANTKWAMEVARQPENTMLPAVLDDFQMAVETDKPLASIKDKINNIGSTPDVVFFNVNNKYVDRTDALTQLTRLPVFLIFTDIHGFGRYLERIEDFHDNNCASYCKDVLCLGDIVHDKFADDFTFMTGSDFGKNVLLTIGNHDCYDGTTVGGVTVNDLYNKFFTNVALWNVVQPTGASANGYCYYYKDYNNAIRLIVLNEYYWDNAQRTWFESTLESARTSGLAVIVAQHQGNYTETEYEHLQDYAFGTKQYDFIRYTAGYIDRRNAVDSFIANGGEFIGWINGHTHCEQFGTFTVNGRKQFSMTFSNAGEDKTSRQKIVGYSQDCFYYLAIDTTNKWVYVLTIGQASNKWFHRNLMLMYNYQTQEVVEYY